MWYRHGSIAALALTLLLGGYALRESLAAPSNRVTTLYDVFGKSPEMRKDWGYSALIEYGARSH
jgi:7,8-dihydropterin-6-yl-methyl-4-(beta-D-ribofuranosyl)aminobenzene 5'-phosphate synthase